MLTGIGFDAGDKRCLHDKTDGTYFGNLEY